MRKLFRMFRTGLTLLLVVIISFIVPIELVSASSKGGAGAYTFLKPDGSGKMKAAAYSTAWKIPIPEGWSITDTLVDKKLNIVMVMYDTESQDHGLVVYDLTTGKQKWKKSLVNIFKGDYETSTETLKLESNGEVFITGDIYEERTVFANTEYALENRTRVSKTVLAIQVTTGKIIRKITYPAPDYTPKFLEVGPWLLPDGRLMVAGLTSGTLNNTTLGYYDDKGNLLKVVERDGLLMHVSANEYVYLLDTDKYSSTDAIIVKNEAGKVLRQYTYKYKQGKLQKNEEEEVSGPFFMPDGRFYLYAEISDKTKENARPDSLIYMFSKQGKLLWMHKTKSAYLTYKTIGTQLYAINHIAETIVEIDNGKMLGPAKLANEGIRELEILPDGSFFGQGLEKYNSGADQNDYYIGAVKPSYYLYKATVPSEIELAWADKDKVLLIHYNNTIQISLLRIAK
ncbi:hypothetical protein [Paenibacillus agilis]|uniref:PQQ-binding-like beta-propeller repeat protein n=1 Tax=Paenibacillus agilis TaxID=3020863 RepID=A0A559IGN3_9BACL|nr:hypothetical protein [Paenibacillus agilis]TVX86816.1 hypothetical protein FPZ44_23145 [Paenibacillus agilis]